MFQSTPPSVRKIKRIVVHCTDTRPSVSVDHVMQIFKQRGWRNPGYHYLVKPDGSVVPILPEAEIANGAKGYNSTSIHVAYIGGRNASNRNECTLTLAQNEALFTLCRDLLGRYPGAELVSHYELNPMKGCPLFNARKNYELWEKKNSSTS